MFDNPTGIRFAFDFIPLASVQGSFATVIPLLATMEMRAIACAN